MQITYVLLAFLFLIGISQAQYSPANLDPRVTALESGASGNVAKTGDIMTGPLTNNAGFYGNGSGLTNLTATGSGFPLTNNVSLAGFTISNGTFIGNLDGSTNLTGYVATNNPRFLAALTNVSTLQTVLNAGSTATNAGVALGSTDLTQGKVYINGEGGQYTNKPALVINRTTGATGPEISFRTAGAEVATVSNGWYNGLFPFITNQFVMAAESNIFFRVAGGTNFVGMPGITVSGGNVGIGVTAPTAYLQLKAGTATPSNAPLKFTSGTLNTTPEQGAVEFDGANFYVSPTNVRYQVVSTKDISASALAAIASGKSTTNTIVEGLVGQTTNRLVFINGSLTSWQKNGVEQ